MRHFSVSVHLGKKFELDKSKLAQVRQFTADFQKIQNLKKSERLNRFSCNLIPKILHRYIIFVCWYRMTAKILQKLELSKTFFFKLSVWDTRRKWNFCESNREWKRTNHIFFMRVYRYIPSQKWDSASILYISCSNKNLKKIKFQKVLRKLILHTNNS